MYLIVYKHVHYGVIGFTVTPELLILKFDNKKIMTFEILEPDKDLKYIKYS